MTLREDKKYMAMGRQHQHIWDDDVSIAAEERRDPNRMKHFFIDEKLPL